VAHAGGNWQIADTEPIYLQYIYMRHCTQKYYIDVHIKQ